MHRKLLPIALMYVNGQEPIEGRTRLQKMVFLMQQKINERALAPLNGHDYEFVPYDYGPFSKELYDDLDTLIAEEFVEDAEEEFAPGKLRYEYYIDSDGNDFVEDQQTSKDAQVIIDLAREIKTEYNDVRLSDLIDDVYSKYPEYAENSIY